MADSQTTMDNAALLLGKLIGVAAAVSIAALVVQFATPKIASFKPTYGTAFIASLLGFFASYALRYVVDWAIVRISNRSDVSGIVLSMLLTGLFVHAAFYSFMLKSPEGVSLGYARACFVSIIQLIVIAIIIGVILMLAGGKLVLERN